MLEQRHFAFVGDPLDQRFTTARHDDVDVIGHLQHFTDRSPVRGRYQLNRMFRQPRLGQTFGHTIHDRMRRVIAF